VPGNVAVPHARCCIPAVWSVRFCLPVVGIADINLNSIFLTGREQMDERAAYIALNMMERVGPVRVRALISHLGSASAIFEASPLDLQSAQGVGKELAAAIVQQRRDIDWQGEMDRAERMGVGIVTFVDEDYPKPLAAIHDPPLALYVKGTFETRDKQSIALVGTRRPTQYGRATAENLAFHLGKLGFSIVSGLALGIDTMAHRGALKARGRTLGVLGGALDCMYPASNRDLAREISEDGAVLSEFPFGRKPDKTTFPMRNRVVSGLSMGVVVVEAGVRSGAMITVNQALEQGRCVFAVPGRIDSHLSAGPHDLIRNGARLVEGVDDILDELDCLVQGSVKGERDVRSPVRLSEEERCLIHHLADGEASVDVLTRTTGLPCSRVNALLIGLEMKKQVRMLPGQTVELISATQNHDR